MHLKLLSMRDDGVLQVNVFGEIAANAHLHHEEKAAVLYARVSASTSIPAHILLSVSECALVNRWGDLRGPEAVESHDVGVPQLHQHRRFVHLRARDQRNA